MRPLPPEAAALPEPLVPLGDVDGILDLAAIFGRDAPLEVEVGSGKGQFLLDEAAACPGHNFLGIERAVPYARLIRYRLLRDGRSNVRLLAADAADVFHRLLPTAAADRVHVLFPDPWPKKRHHKRRLNPSRVPARRRPRAPARRRPQHRHGPSRLRRRDRRGRRDHPRARAPALLRDRRRPADPDQLRHAHGRRRRHLRRAQLDAAVRVLRRASAVVAPPDRVFAVLEDPKMADDLNPPFLRVSVVQAPWLPRVGERTRVAIVHREATFELETEIAEYRRGRFLLERQVEGPFASFERAVNVEEDGDGARVTEVLAYACRFGLLGRLFDWLSLGRDLATVLTTRQARLRELLEAPADSQPR